MSNLSEIIDRLERVGQGEGAHALRHVRDVAEQRQADLVAKDDRIRDYMNICEDLSRQLEEARGRIGELETSLSAQTRITDAGHRSQKEMLERIASLEAALKLIKDFPITHPQENQDAANMAEIARSTLEGKDNA